MRAVALLGGVLVAISACGGGGTAESAPATVTVTAPAAPPELDGTQGYGDIGELRADLAARGLECEDFTEVSVPSAAAAGHCDVGGQDLVLALWQSPVERDSRTSDLIIAADDDACFVLGRGNGAWSVDGDGNPGLCAKVADALGGEVWPQ